VRLSLALDRLVWGDDFRGRHLTNLLLHLAVVVAVFRLIDGLRLSFARAWLAAALFAAHPIHTYNVSALMGRTDLLCTLFFVTTVAACSETRSGRLGGPWIAAPALALALLSKELAVTAPLAACLVLALKRELRSNLTTVLWLFAVDAAYLVLRFTLLRPNEQDLAVYLQVVPLQLVRNLLYYAGGLVFPFASFPLRSVVESAPFLAVGVGLFLLAIPAWWLWRRRLSLDLSFWFGCGWVVLTLLPVLLLFQRRFLYLASVGLCAAFSSVLGSLPRPAGRATATAVLLLFAWRVHDASVEWRLAARRSAATLEELAPRVEALKGRDLFLVNVPAGLGEAHLFTHDSIRFALAWKLGWLPDVHVLTRLQRSTAGRVVQVSQATRRVVTRIQPGPQDYFVFDVPELLDRGGRYLSPGASFGKGPFRIEVTGASPSNEVSELTVSWAEDAWTRRLLVVRQD
jgi:hypothetical protein